MLVVVHHHIQDQSSAFSRGDDLIKHVGAPSGMRALQFYPSADHNSVTCLWEAESVKSVQDYVDRTLGDASRNDCYEVDMAKALCDRAEQLPNWPRA